MANYQLFQVGKNVTAYKVGDHVGVGCVVDSCLACSSCKVLNFAPANAPTSGFVPDTHQYIQTPAPAPAPALAPTPGSLQDGEEHTCLKGMTGTYNGKISHGHLATDKGWTFGGYSASHTVHQRFVPTLTLKH